MDGITICARADDNVVQRGTVCVAWSNSDVSAFYRFLYMDRSDVAPDD